jgi:chemotaxis protein CheD
MAIKTVGIGEWIVSTDITDILKTYALGSCVAVMVFDSKLHIAGMLHVALPDSSVDAERARQLPGYFADTGLPRMIEEMKRLGVVRSHIWVKLAGGSSVMDAGGLFDIGKRNVLAVKKQLWRSSLGPIAEDVGGSISRTVSLAVGSGETTLSSGNTTWTI